MIKVPTINIDIQPTIDQLRTQIETIKDEQKTDLRELEDIVKSKKKQMEDTIERMKQQIDKHKQEFNEFKNDWNKHDAKWKINHSPEFQRRTIVFLKDIETMEASVRKYAMDTPKEITNFFNTKQKLIIQHTEEMIKIIESRLNKLADDTKKTISDTIKSLIPPIVIPVDIPS